MKISPARRAAFEILRKIETERLFSSALLPVYEDALDQKDRALCHQLTLGVLRRRMRLDKIIEQLTGGKKLDRAIRIILRLGLYQLIYLDKIPAHAAINEAVNLAQQAKKTSAKSFVNAVLRNYTRRPIELNFTDEIERVAVETSHPRRLVERWIRQFGFDETEKLAAENNRTPASAFRLTAKSDESTIEMLRRLDLKISESKIVKGAWLVGNSNEMLRLFADEGKIYFQDEGSQLVADSVRLKTDEKFLDVCAAPGSKATQIANSHPNNFIVAGDFIEPRIKILQANRNRQIVESMQIARYDAEKDLPFADESFDRILVDAPCSGTGTIRHNPEIRYFLEEKDFPALAEKQLRILKNASKILKKNGRLIYSTCSLEREENEQVAERFLAENKEFTKIKSEIGEQFITAENYARTFPPRDETDGFFIAVFEKSRVFGKV